MTLDELKENESARIVQILDEQLEESMLNMGFIVGEDVKLDRIAPLKDPILITSGLNYISIRKEDAKKILIEKNNAN
ncbi:MAG: ferrous iron transport protein A [Flavobacteriales bacterium]|nr:ferrous iron transport protein A [Flavobacteriales bacterium]MCW8912234.1 ferrous iron transport protein A [Flavobacteriales bacterium]MCW8936901.1 ferrous iron transport protein A [Flavobacteriales bacterium]MCW8940591.1 ferrous iron transport protein A [Flavobacteriales bacterium]MCW8968926.1 ferrous iron transport protein A [Flavobacteriales bacterium]